MTSRRVNLGEAGRNVVVILRRNLRGWRFESWMAPPGSDLPEVPPRRVLGLSFISAEDAKVFFTRLLADPEGTLPPEKPQVAGLMPLAPACQYYWPPTFERCVENLELDLQLPPERQLKIGRVIILGAGFSAAFQFATADKIVGGVMSFFQQRGMSGWLHHQYECLTLWLDRRFPRWRTFPPTLYELVDTFYEPIPDELLRDFVQRSSPLRLWRQRISWERGNCAAWLRAKAFLPRDAASPFVTSFEALVSMYLLIGLQMEDVMVSWAREVFDSLDVHDVIVTFNWDVIPETIMTQTEVPFCRYDWTPTRTKLIKLHGSADLFGLPNTDMIGDAEAHHERFECVTERLWRARTSDDVLVATGMGPFARRLLPQERYNKAPLMIMPPLYSYGYGYELIQHNWRRARAALTRAREVHVVGNSMGERDEAFRALVHEVSSGWDDGVTVDVWNPDPAVASRAASIFGPRASFHQAPASAFRLRPS
jgi:hypothetical protein